VPQTRSFHTTWVEPHRIPDQGEAVIGAPSAGVLSIAGGFNAGCSACERARERWIRRRHAPLL